MRWLVIALILFSIALWGVLLGSITYFIGHSLFPLHAELAGKIVGACVSLGFLILLGVRAWLVRTYVTTLFEKDFTP